MPITAHLDLTTLSLTHSLTHSERTDTRTQKAKDWDGLETRRKFCRVEIPKVHGLNFAHGRGSTRNDAVFCYIIVADRLLALA